MVVFECLYLQAIIYIMGGSGGGFEGVGRLLNGFLSCLGFILSGFQLVFCGFQLGFAGFGYFPESCGNGSPFLYLMIESSKRHICLT